MFLSGFSFLTEPSVWQDFLNGTILTLSISFFGVLIGIVLGILIGIGRLIGNKAVRAICVSYVNIYRGTPLLLQVYIMYFGIPELTGYKIEAYIAGVIAIGLNSAAYISEIYRGGILSVDKGQTEAARSLGLSQNKTLRLIILPQATKNILPSLGNEFISIIKETAIVSVIALKDITYYAKQIGSTSYDYIPPLLMAGAIYFTLVIGLTKVVEIFERKLKND